MSGHRPDRLSADIWRSAPPSRRGQRRSCSTANNPTGAVYTKPPLRPSAARVGDKPIFILSTTVYRGLCTRKPCRIHCGPARPAGAAFDRPELFKAVGDDGLAHQISRGTSIHPMLRAPWHIGRLPRASAPPGALSWTALETSAAAPIYETSQKDGRWCCAASMRWGLCCLIPEETRFYAFPDIRAFGLRSDEFCLASSDRRRGRSSTRLLRNEKGISAYPYCCGSGRRSNAAWIVSGISGKAQTGKNLTTYRNRR